MAGKNTSIFLLGCQGAGKTSFIAGLAVLSQPNNPSSFQLIYNDEATATLITDLRALVARQQWPAGTSNVVSLDFQLRAAGKSFDLSVLEYPGEDLLIGMESMNISNKELMFEKIDMSDCFILLLDPTQDLKTVINSNDKHATERRQNSLAQAIGHLTKKRIEKGALLPVIVVAISKADMLINEHGGTIEDVARDNETLLHQLGEYSREKIRNCAISACGPLDQADLNSNNYPTSPQPEGYEKLFELIGHELSVRRNKRTFLVGISAIFLVVICFLGFWVVDYVNNSNFLEQIAVTSVGDMGSLVNGKPEISIKAANLLDERVKKWFSSYNSQINNLPNWETLERTKIHLETLEHIEHHSFHIEIGKLLDRIEKLREEALYKAILTAKNSRKDDLCFSLAAEYFQYFPHGSHHGDVEGMLIEINQSKRKKMIYDIQSYKIASKSSIDSKILKINDFMDEFRNTTDHSQTMELATDFCKRLISANSISLNLTSCGSSDDEHIIEVYKNFNMVITHKSDLGHSTIHKAVTMTLEDKLKVKFFDADIFVHDLLAEQTYSLLDQLSSFDGKKKILIKPTLYGDKYKPYFKAKLQLPSSGAVQWQEVSEQQLTAYSQFIYPGDKWAEVLKERE
jgi:hypothetical protein